MPGTNYDQYLVAVRKKAIFLSEAEVCGLRMTYLRFIEGRNKCKPNFTPAWILTTDFDCLVIG